MLAALLLAVLAQDPFPRPGAEPQGQVLDAAGKPIASARVSLQCDLELSAPWRKSIEQVLQRTPLPWVMSNKDGSFVLPLNDTQRLLGSAGEGVFFLLVEKEGFGRWAERLPLGPFGYHGSKVVLHPLQDKDRFWFQVAGGVLGQRVEVRRLWDSDVEPAVLAVLDALGRASVVLPLLPNPPPALLYQEAVPLGYRSRLEGRSWLPVEPVSGPRLPAVASPPRPIDRRREAAAGPPVRVTVRVFAESGGPISGARVLVQDQEFTEPLPPPFLTDAEGRAEVLLAKRGPFMCRVGHRDHMPEESTLVVRAGDAADCELRLRPARMWRIHATSGEEPVPFAPILALPRNPRQPAVAPLQRSLHTDSLGRLCLLGPRDEQLNLRIVQGGGFQIVAFEPGEGIARIEFDLVPWTAVLLPHGSKLASFRYQSNRGAGAASGAWARIEGASGYLLRVVTPGLQLATLTLAQGQQVTLTPADHALGTLDRGIHLVDRCGTRDAVSLRILDADGKPAVGARIHPTPSGPDGWLPETERIGPPFPNDSGEYPVLLAREKPTSLTISHPLHVRQVVQVPAAAGNAKRAPVVVQLVRGCRIHLRLTPRLHGLVRERREITLLATSDTRPPERRTLALRPQLLDGDQVIELEALEEVPPGSYVLGVALPGKELVQRALVVGPGAASVLDLDEVVRK